MNRPLKAFVDITSQLSPYPPSFDGSTTRFGFALFSLTTVGLLGLMTTGWMAREIWADRYHTHPKEPLFAFRGIMLFCGVAAFIRCLPEAVYMTTYREASPAFTAHVIAVKRYLDAFALVPVAIWMGLLWTYYSGICSQLSSQRYARYQPSLALPRLKRLFAALAIVFMIAALIAIGKR